MKNDILIKLYRKYSKDEVLCFLRKELSKKDIENGKLNSEILYLENELSKLNKKVNLTNPNSKNIDIRIKKINSQKREIINLRKTISDLLIKYHV